MDKNLKKSCKLCVALAIGILIGIGVMKLMENTPVKRAEDKSCKCDN